MIVLGPLSLAAQVAPVPEPGRGWRAIATIEDRRRLRDGREAWRRALTDARAGDGAAAIAADPALFDPDDALDTPAPPTGGYRCRIVAFGGGHAPIGAWRHCQVTDAGAAQRFAMIDGERRFEGTVYPDASHRAVFLGTVAYAGERRSAAYGHAAGRDMAGVVERIGERRWRLVLPRPHYGALLDVVELVPEG